MSDEIKFFFKSLASDFAFSIVPNIFFTVLGLFLFLFGGFILGMLISGWIFNVADSTMMDNLQTLTYIIFILSWFILPITLFFTYKALYLFAFFTFFFDLLLLLLGLLLSFFKRKSDERLAEKVKRKTNEYEKSHLPSWGVLAIIFVVPPIVTTIFGAVAGLFSFQPWLAVVSVYFLVGALYGLSCGLYLWTWAYFVKPEDAPL